MMSKHEHLMACLSKWLGKMGFLQAPIPASHAPLEPDIAFASGKHLLLVEAKVAGAYRSKVFPALVGDLVLRASHLGESASGADAMLALMVKQLNAQAVSDLERYARAYLPSLNWFLIDEDGNGEACLLGERHRPLAGPQVSSFAGGQASPPVRDRLFSPSRQWLLKLLLLPGIEPRYWGGPRHRPGSIVRLADAGGVSQSLVSSFVKRFEEAGYLRRKNGAPIIVRPRELLDDWFYASKLEARGDVAMRSMHGESVDQVVARIGSLHREQQAPPAIVGHHLACHLHGLGRSSVRSAILYVPEPGRQMAEELGLVKDDSDAPSLWCVGEYMKSVAEGAVRIRDIHVCDILQCYLDVRASRARGEEQADYILEQVLLPHFDRRD